MKVLSINPERQHLSGIEFSEEYFPKGATKNDKGQLLLDKDYIEEIHLKVGNVYEYSDIDKMVLESDKRRAKSRAMWYLTRRDYASGELHKKLLEKFLPEACDYAVARMCELGLINDKLYAKGLAEKLITVNGLSPKVALYKMREKGIDKALAEEVILERDDNTEALAIELIERKYLRYLTDEKGVKKVYAALIRKGFSYSDAKKALGNFKSFDY